MPAPHSCAAFGTLYELALAEGQRVLHSFRRIDADRRTDLAIETLLAESARIFVARRPRAFFAMMLRYRALSWLRSGRALLVGGAENDDELQHMAGGLSAQETSMVYRLDAHRALDAMKSRDRAFVVADAGGFSRHEIADAYETSRANVDQIISRVRRRRSPGAY